jgi:hypothetical protein
MLMEWLETLQNWEAAAFIRRSVYVYPLVNATHILSLALLVGGILVADLRMLGFFRAVEAGPLLRLMTNVSAQPGMARGAGGRYRQRAAEGRRGHFRNHLVGGAVCGAVDRLYLNRRAQTTNHAAGTIAPRPAFSRDTVCERGGVEGGREWQPKSRRKPRERT